MAFTTCPHCSTRLKLPDSRLDSQVRCPSCSNSFAATSDESKSQVLQASSRRHAPKAKKSPLGLILGVGGLGIMGVIWMMWPDQSTPVVIDEVAVNNSAPAPVKPDLVEPEHHPALRNIVFISRALSNSNLPVFFHKVDQEAWLPQINEQETRHLKLLSASEQKTFQDQLISWFQAESKFNDFANQAIATAIYLEVDSCDLGFEVHTSGQPEIRWILGFNKIGSSWQLAKFKSIHPQKLAAAPEQAADEPAKPKGPYIETEGGGRILAGTISKVAPWADLDNSMRQKIEELIDAGASDGGLESKLAREDLKKLTPQCVPQILNRIVALPLDGTDDRLTEVAALDRILQTVSGRVSTIPMRTFGGSSGADLQEKQKAAVAAWFSWWKLWGKNWDGWREKTGLPDPNERGAGRTRQ